jgi:hypothetical protein
MQKSTQLDALGPAMAKAQRDMAGAKKGSSNPFFKSKYADLASVAEACREALTSNGLSVIQGPESEDGDMVILHTMLLHESGQWIESTLRMRPVKADPQGMGSCITYARRYTLAAMCGVAPEDDDGNAASGKEVPKGKEPWGQETRGDIEGKTTQQVLDRASANRDKLADYAKPRT